MANFTSKIAQRTARGSVWSIVLPFQKYFKENHTPPLKKCSKKLFKHVSSLRHILNDFSKNSLLFLLSSHLHWCCIQQFKEEEKCFHRDMFHWCTLPFKKHEKTFLYYAFLDFKILFSCLSSTFPIFHLMQLFPAWITGVLPPGGVCKGGGVWVFVCMCAFLLNPCLPLPRCNSVRLHVVLTFLDMLTVCFVPQDYKRGMLKYPWSTVTIVTKVK